MSPEEFLTVMSMTRIMLSVLVFIFVFYGCLGFFEWIMEADVEREEE